MHHSSFAVLPFIVASLAYYALGAIWYTPLFGKTWGKEVGHGMGGGIGQTFVWMMLGQLVSSFLYALGVYMVIMLGDFYSFKGAMIAGISVSAFFVLSINSGKALFQGKPVLFAIDAGYNILGAFMIALILAFWR